MRLRTRKSSWVKNSGPERRFYLNGQLLGSWLVPSARLTSPWPAGGELFLRRIDCQVAASPLIADNRRPLRIVAREPRLKSSFYACSWFCRPPSRPRVGGRKPFGAWRWPRASVRKRDFGRPSERSKMEFVLVAIPACPCTTGLSPLHFGIVKDAIQVAARPRKGMIPPE